MLWRLPASTLSSLLARGEVSAVDLLGAHLQRVDEVDGRVQAFTSVMREQAGAEAEASDERRRRGEARGPLDGVPVTLAECFDLAGRPTTLGLPSWRRHIARSDAELVAALRRAGAIVLGRTNVSQALLFVEARNPVYGQTANPWSLAHTPGGSSGGEAAALAAGMSPLGLGSDLGGGLRVPAHFCGACALRPTPDRLPIGGYRTVDPGQEAVRATAGPMARAVADLSLLLRGISGAHAAASDPQVPPLRWEEPASPGVAGLRVGTYRDDGVVPASASLARALDRAAEVLRGRGCEVLAFDPPDVRGAICDALGILSADGGAGLRAALAGGEVDPSVDLLRRIAAMPSGMRRAAAGAARAFGQANVALLLEALGEKTVSELWSATERLRAYRAELRGAMDRAGLDALLCPPYPTPALPHGASRGFALAASYALPFSAAGLPAGVVPVTRVRASETVRPASRDRLLSRAADVDAKSAGLPVGVQVVGRAWKDHVVLALLAAIEGDVSRDEDFPATPVDPPR